MKKLKQAALVLILLLPISLVSLAQTQTIFDGTKKINGAEIYCKVIGSGEPILVVHGGPGLAHDYLHRAI